MTFKLSERSLSRAEGVNLKLINLILLAIRRTPIDFGVAWMGGLRTEEQQNQLFREGYSQCDGYEKISKHQSGNAIDLNRSVMPGTASPFKLAYEQIANYLDGGALPDCTNDNFAAVHEVCFAGIESVLTNRRIVIPNDNRKRRVFANG